MAGTMKENYNELCRLCASKTNLIIGISIFGDDGKSQDITKKISTCLPIKVHEKDVLPKLLCADCVYKLEMCFTFRQKSLETETFLLELILSDTVQEKHKKLEMGIINVPGNQIEIIHQQEEILDPNGSNLLVNQGIIINHEGMVIHNTELDQIEFQPGTHEIVQDVSSEITQDIPHEIAETAIHNQHLNLHDESTIAQFVQQDMQISETRLRVQDLELMQEQRELIPEEYAVISNKTVESSHTKPYLALRNQAELMEVKEEDIKKETQVEMVSVTGNFPEPSESEITDDDFDNNVDESVIVEQKVKNDNDIIVEHFYQEERQLMLKENEVETTTTADVVDLYCNICEKPVKDKEDYVRHYTEHFIKCTLCSGVFTTQETYEIHQKTTHPRRNTRASPKPENSPKSRTRLKSLSNDDVDDNFFKDENNSDNENDNKKKVQEEEEEEHDESASKNGKRKKLEPKVCKECGKSYKTNYKLAEHMRRHTGEQPYKCTVCEKAFRSKIGLAQHAAKHTGQYDYSCPTCGKGFQCKSYLIVHQRVHSDEKPYQCSTCGQKFKTKQSLLDHKNRHLGVKPYTCEMCGRGFITKGLCKSHQKVHSGTDNRQYPCTVCNKLFVSKSYLATHVRIHTGEKPFMCEVCGKGFLTRVDLRIHSTMHTGEKSFVCEICGKAFARRDALRCHRRSHTGERPYRCNVCGQSFTQFSPMAIHKRLHTGERPYSCEVCKKTFVSRSTMMSHRKKHTP